MTFVIAEPCVDVKDRSCIEVCPVDCIHETTRMLVIDPEACIDCSACEPECPVTAIYPLDRLPQEWQPYVWVNAAAGEGTGAVESELAEFLGPHPPSRRATFGNYHPSG